MAGVNLKVTTLRSITALDK